MATKDDLLTRGIQEEKIERVTDEFINQFQTILEDYDISIPSESEFYVGVEVLFDVIIELGESEAIEESVDEYIDILLDEFGTQAGRNNIHFLSGRISSEYPETELANVSKSLYGELKRREME